MPLFDNESRIQQLEEQKDEIFAYLENPLIAQAFTKDFVRRFAWSTNAIEGNTLSLEETIEVIDYDEVRSHHTYAEYTDAKNAYYAAEKMLIPFAKTAIDEEWVLRANGYIRQTKGQYRTISVYIGSLAETIYYPPDPKDVPQLMADWLRTINADAVETAEAAGKNGTAEAADIFEKIAASHIRFERIHPFADGNGRTGRMILNQQLMSHDLLPVCIAPSGKYREAFRRFDKRGDISEMVYVLVKSEQESFARVCSLAEKLSHDRDFDMV